MDSPQRDFEPFNGNQKQNVISTVGDETDEIIQNISRNMRKIDWTYLGRHPEIRAIIRVIVTEAVKNKKDESIYSFAANLFQAKNKKTLKKLINKQLKWVHEQTKSATWSPADGTVPFPVTSSTSLDNVNETYCEENVNNADDKCDEELLNQSVCPEHFKPSC